MPRSTMSVEAKALDDGLRSDERRITQVIGKIVTGVRNHPSKARQIWDSLAVHGITEETYNEPEVVEKQSSSKRAQLKRKETLKQVKVDARKEAETIAVSSGALQPIQADFTSLARCTVPYLKEICRELAPTVLTLGSLTQHARALQKQGLLEILEFITGFAPETEVYPKILCRTVLMDLLTRSARLRGQRALKLTLPPAWCLNGLYRITKLEQGIVEIGHRFTLARFTVEIGKVPGAASVDKIDLEDLQLLHNYSEMKVALALEGACLGYFLHLVNNDHEVEQDDLEMLITPNPKRARGGIDMKKLVPTKEEGKSTVKQRMVVKQEPEEAEPPKTPPKEEEIRAKAVEPECWNDADAEVPPPV
eukprot:4101259-Amphidinium_carterae.4